MVHETHSKRDKLHHVSKVYFYSVRHNSDCLIVNFIQNQVSDILQNSSSTELEDQVNLLRAEANSEEEQQQAVVTPRINSSVCNDEFFDRDELPFLPISSPREVQGSPFQRWPRVHTGTSSLRFDIIVIVIIIVIILTMVMMMTRRKGVEVGSPGGSRVGTPSQSPFPLTNSSLYRSVNHHLVSVHQSYGNQII